MFACFRSLSVNPVTCCPCKIDWISIRSSSVYFRTERIFRSCCGCGFCVPLSHRVKVVVATPILLASSTCDNSSASRINFNVFLFMFSSPFVLALYMRLLLGCFVSVVRRPYLNKIGRESLKFPPLAIYRLTNVVRGTKMDLVKGVLFPLLLGLPAASFLVLLIRYIYE